MLMSRDLAMSRGIDSLGYIVCSAMVGCDPAIMGMGPVPAIRAAVDKVFLECAKGINLYRL